MLKQETSHQKLTPSNHTIFVMLTKETSHQKLTPETHTIQSHHPITPPPTPFCHIDAGNITPQTNTIQSHHHPHHFVMLTQETSNQQITNYFVWLAYGFLIPQNNKTKDYAKIVSTS